MTKIKNQTFMPSRKLYSVFILAFSSLFLSACSGMPWQKETAIPIVTEPPRAKNTDKVDIKPDENDDPAIEAVDAEECEKVEQSSAEPTVITPVKPSQNTVIEKEVVEVKKVIHTELTVLGDVEYVTVGNKDLRLKARIDTGAQTTSLGVSDLQNFERDGEPWVNFIVKDKENNTSYEFQRPLKRKTRIKQHSDKTLKRAVVAMHLKIGQISRQVDVTLSNRENFKYTVLIGRNFLESYAVVDVSGRYITLDSE